MNYVIDLLENRKVFFIYLIILFLGSVIPLGTIASNTLMDNFTLHIRWDYLLHAMVYLPLPLLLILYLRSRTLKLWVVVVFVSLSVTCLFELAQMIIPYRSFNINDMVANGVGVTLGLIPAGLVLRRFSGSARSVH